MKPRHAWLFVVLLLQVPGSAAAETAGPALVSDASTEIEYITFHSRPKAISRPLLRDLIQAFERPGLAPVRWLVLAGSEREAADLRHRLALQGVPDVHARVRFLVKPEAYSTWPRDLYVFRTNGRPGAYEMLPLSPEDPAGSQTVRAVTDETSQAEPAGAGAAGSFPFAGGDLTSDDVYVYVGEKSVAKMLEAGWASREEALAALEGSFGRKVMVLPSEDPHHDRCHMPLGVIRGQRTSLVADPVAALRLLRGMDAAEKERVIRHYIERQPWMDAAVVRRELEALFSLDEKGLQRYADSAYVRALDLMQFALEKRGIRVVRLPTLHNRMLPGEQLPLGLYYVNMVQDTYRDIGGEGVRHKLVLPKYGIDALDGRVREILSSLDDFEIRMVEAVREGWRGAGIHCLLQAAGARITPVSNPGE